MWPFSSNRNKRSRAAYSLSWPFGCTQPQAWHKTWEIWVQPLAKCSAIVSLIKAITSGVSSRERYRNKIGPMQFSVSLENYIHQIQFRRQLFLYFFFEELKCYAPPKFTLPKISYIPDGTISVIRFIRSDRKLDIWGGHFKLPQSLVYSYVRAKIITCLQEIQVFYCPDIKTFCCRCADI